MVYRWHCGSIWFLKELMNVLRIVALNWLRDEIGTVSKGLGVRG
jgi:hypothetical protein